jgi:hypothetical protein
MATRRPLELLPLEPFLSLFQMVPLSQPVRPSGFRQRLARPAYQFESLDPDDLCLCLVQTALLSQLVRPLDFRQRPVELARRVVPVLCLFRLARLLRLAKSPDSRQQLAQLPRAKPPRSPAL